MRDLYTIVKPRRVIYSTVQARAHDSKFGLVALEREHIPALIPNQEPSG